MNSSMQKTSVWPMRANRDVMQQVNKQMIKQTPRVALKAKFLLSGMEDEGRTLNVERR